jgi:agmatinase
MATHGYDSGRLDLPFVGHCTFGKQPVCLDWKAIDAHVAVLGAPFDMGTQYRAGARFGPRAIREASTLFSFGHGGAYDFEDDVTYLPVDKVRIVDVGDADIIHTDTLKSHDNIEAAVRSILAAGALPVVLGGDHSVHIPCIRAFDDQPPVHIIHIDAHLDFVDERHGVRYGHGNPLRRASEMAHVTGFTQLGIRNVSSSNREDYEAARAAGSDILSVRDVRRLGPCWPAYQTGSDTMRPSTSTASIPRSRPEPAPPATAVFSTTRCWRYSRAWPRKAISSASTWSRWRPITT